jgi:hypothetical protein
MKTNDPTTEESKDHPPVPALPDTDITEEETTSDAKGKPVPNSKPRPAPVNTDDTYVYKDYAQTPLESLDTSTCHKKVPPQCLQAQKLPSKLAVMLTDPGELNITFSCFLITYFIISILSLCSPTHPSLHKDLVRVVNWLPHGRSWKIVNRDQFTEIALPRYFGHKNYASFVRIVNAWGFRRVTSGIDRDSYYHEVRMRTCALMDSDRVTYILTLDPSCHPFFYHILPPALSSRKTRTTPTHEATSINSQKDPNQ